MEKSIFILFISCIFLIGIKSIKVDSIENKNNAISNKIQEPHNYSSLNKIDLSKIETISLQKSNENLKLKQEFEKWSKQYQKNYKDTDEINKRFEIFRQNYEFIKNHDKNKNSYTLGLGPFADLDFNEFKYKILFKKPYGELEKLEEKLLNN